jgi:type I restriction enzyme M protein
MASLDYPPKLRSFGKLISGFTHLYDYEVFSDLIDYTIACLLYHGDKTTADRLKARYKEYYDKFQQLYLSLMQTTHDCLEHDSDWFDVLGTTYEIIASGSKRSGLGQFFTPKTVCDFMAKIQAPEEPVTDLRVNDPACGSGRTLLAFNSVAPGNFLYGDDLDPICTKMAAINLAIHGCKGQACNTNSLWPEDWRFGYQVNPYLYSMMGIPHLFHINKEQSATYRHWEIVKQQNETPKPAPLPEPKQTPPAQNTFKQLTMF